MSNVRIAVIDYGMGNLRSVEKACIHAGFDACVTDSPRKIDDATHVILPGVGAVGDALQRLREKGLFDCASAQAKKGKPFLGICLGMQMLFTKSFEFGEHDCLGLVPGRVVPFQIEERVPHIGWNDIKVHQRNPLLDGRNGEYVYFVHSYYYECADEVNVICKTEYGKIFHSAVNRDNIFGVQFHPEKSHDNGIQLLKNFANL